MAIRKRILVVLAAGDVPRGEQIRVACPDGVTRQAEVLDHSHLRPLGVGGVLIKPLRRGYGTPIVTELPDETEVELVLAEQRLPDPDEVDDEADDEADDYYRDPLAAADST